MIKLLLLNEQNYYLFLFNFFRFIIIIFESFKEFSKVKTQCNNNFMKINELEKKS